MPEQAQRLTEPHGRPAADPTTSAERRERHEAEPVFDELVSRALRALSVLRRDRGDAPLVYRDPVLNAPYLEGYHRHDQDLGTIEPDPEVVIALSRQLRQALEAKVRTVDCWPGRTAFMIEALVLASIPALAADAQRLVDSSLSPKGAALEARESIRRRAHGLIREEDADCLDDIFCECLFPGGWLDLSGEESPTGMHVIARFLWNNFEPRMHVHDVGDALEISASDGGENFATAQAEWIVPLMAKGRALYRRADPASEPSDEDGLDQHKPLFQRLYGTASLPLELMERAKREGEALRREDEAFFLELGRRLETVCGEADRAYALAEAAFADRNAARQRVEAAEGRVKAWTVLQERYMGVADRRDASRYLGALKALDRGVIPDAKVDDDKVLAGYRHEGLRLEFLSGLPKDRKEDRTPLAEAERRVAELEKAYASAKRDAEKALTERGRQRAGILAEDLFPNLEGARERLDALRREDERFVQTMDAAALAEHGLPRLKADYARAKARYAVAWGEFAAVETRYWSFRSEVFSLRSRCGHLGLFPRGASPEGPRNPHPYLGDI